MHNGTIILLQHTSNDNRPQDISLLHFFRRWDKLETRLPYKLSSQYTEDNICYLCGILELFNLVSERDEGIVVPGRINSDSVENFSANRGVSVVFSTQTQIMPPTAEG